MWKIQRNLRVFIHPRWLLWNLGPLSCWHLNAQGKQQLNVAYCRLDWEKRGEASSNFHLRRYSIKTSRMQNAISVELSTISLLDFWMTSEKKQGGFLSIWPFQNLQPKQKTKTTTEWLLPQKKSSVNQQGQLHQVLKLSRDQTAPATFFYVAKPAGDNNFNTARPRKCGLISN